jgi:drug/metabolite transporter (DMT)-like permease
LAARAWVPKAWAVSARPAMPNPDIHRQGILRGIVLVLLAVLVFAAMDTVGKYLMTKFSVPLVAAARYGVNLVLLAAIMLPRHGTALWTTQRTGLVMVRGASLAAATFFAGLALQLMPVGETVALLYLQTFGVLLTAGFALGERVGLAGWLAAAVGFAGVVLIARPGSDLDPLGVLFALAAAGVSIVYILLSRKLAASESTMAMLFYAAIAGTLLFGVMLAFKWQVFSYNWIDIALLFFMGAASLTGHFLFTAAYRFAPAFMLAPFSYFHIALAVLFGWLFYSHVPDGWSFVGMAMIAGSGAAIAIRSHLSKAEPQEI